ncbi:MAG: hypothetical protein N3C61_01010 [Candidatus Micrarchaeota archaeon]|nr:hypothetical protein [Candidatus Micrarchaeota archaeon]
MKLIYSLIVLLFLSGCIQNENPKLEGVQSERQEITLTEFLRVAEVRGFPIECDFGTYRMYIDPEKYTILDSPAFRVYFYNISKGYYLDADGCWREVRMERYGYRNLPDIPRYCNVSDYKMINVTRICFT